MDKKYDSLRIENQICFPLYAASKEVIKKYRPVLDKFDLTYTQYITLMILWECKKINVKELGKRLFLDSGTLTPLLKTLERKGYVTRERSQLDERNLDVKITARGEALKDDLLSVPEVVSSCVKLEAEEAVMLYKLLYKILNQIN